MKLQEGFVRCLTRVWYNFLYKLCMRVRERMEMEGLGMFLDTSVIKFEF